MLAHNEADLSCLALPVTGGDAIGDVIRVIMESVSPASKQDLIVADVLWTWNKYIYVLGLLNKKWETGLSNVI